jgi:hypothetical protein
MTMRDAALLGARLLLGGYKLGPSLPGKLAAFGFLAGGAAAGALIAKMVTSKPAPAEAAAEPSAADA